MSSEPARINFRLYVVTDRHQTAGRALEEIVAAAAQGGAGAIQLREKDLSARDLYALGARLQAALSSYGVPLLINDRLDVALALDAAGVHLAGHSLPTAMARRVLGAGKLLGVSTHSVEEACCAAKDGAETLNHSCPCGKRPSHCDWWHRSHQSAAGRARGGVRGGHDSRRPGRARPV